MTSLALYTEAGMTDQEIRLNTPDEDAAARHMAFGHGLIIDRSSSGVVAEYVESWNTLEDSKPPDNEDDLLVTLNKLSSGIGDDGECNLMDYTMVRLINSQTPVILWLAAPEFIKYLALALGSSDDDGSPVSRYANSPN
jgi:hypothetical protein